jgi:steroid delta-isomerase-like uncharacterized protein
MRATLITAACLVMLASASAQQGKQTTPPAASAGQTMTQTSPSGKPVLEAYVSAWNRHDFAAFDTLLAPDAMHEDIAQGFRGQGPAQTKDFMRALIQGQPDFDWHLTKVVDASPLVAAEWTWTATFTGDSPSGPVVRQRISGRGASIAVVENGRIKHFTDYYDIASFFPKATAGSTTVGKVDQPSQGVATGLDVLEAKVRKAWEDFKNKNKSGFAAILADGFQEAEDDGGGFRDQQTEVAEIDQFNLSQYTLKDFNIEPIGADGALVKYLGEYSGTVAGQHVDGKSAWGEVWVRRGDDWKLLHVQETKVK